MHPRLDLAKECGVSGRWQMACWAGSLCGRSAWRRLYSNAVGILVPTPVDEKVRHFGDTVGYSVHSVWWPPRCCDTQVASGVCLAVISQPQQVSG